MYEASTAIHRQRRFDLLYQTANILVGWLVRQPDSPLRRDPVDRVLEWSLDPGRRGPRRRLSVPRPPKVGIERGSGFVRGWSLVTATFTPSPSNRSASASAVTDVKRTERSGDDDAHTPRTAAAEKDVS
ncbi:hypothetical protein EA472_04215 [Natrarchaeobius oligotrophus]|uniref:Uncharacterized protein n=1 Tax=Natrarchaeobius chitinivorans TaxID=1679083 RepID=A0A3N6MET5_NATCH|nr:hypothetical protein EA472_04215 [Natrarchaeobius chitinivorans]